MTKKITRVLVTGATGFIGHHAVEHIFKKYPDWEVIVVDGPGSASNANRLTDVEVFPVQKKKGKIRFVYHDIRSPFVSVQLKTQIGPVDYMIHFAAETHVDNSIVNPQAFVQTNVVGTFNVLEFARSQKLLKSYVQISTDEVYGPAERGESFKETAATRPSNPYSASKAGADALVQAYARTYGFPGFIIRTMNNIGERQDPEKFVPKTVRALISGMPVIIHGNKKEIASRCWIHPRNFSDAILFLLDRAQPGDIYHVAGDEHDCMEIASRIASVMGVSLKYRLVDFHRTRPGHDLRYALDSEKIHTMGWHEPVGFDKMLVKCIHWMTESRRLHWLGLDPSHV